MFSSFLKDVLLLLVDIGDCHVIAFIIQYRLLIIIVRWSSVCVCVCVVSFKFYFRIISSSLILASSCFEFCTCCTRDYISKSIRGHFM